MKQWSKNASLQLSIEAIVVLIIAITVLGLGLGFVKNLFGGTFKKLEGISNQLGEEDKKRLEQSPDKVSLLSSEITVEGREGNMMLAVRNVESNDKKFLLKQAKKNFLTKIGEVPSEEWLIFCYDGIGSLKLGTTEAADPAKRKTNAKKYITFETFPEKTIQAQRSYIFPVTVKVDAGAPATTYSCKIIIESEKEKEEGEGAKCITVDATDGFCRAAYETKEFTVKYKT